MALQYFFIGYASEINNNLKMFKRRSYIVNVVNEVYIYTDKKPGIISKNKYRCSTIQNH